MLEPNREALQEYCGKFRRADLPDLRLSGIYDLFPNEFRSSGVESSWPDKWPNSEEAGVYFIFGLGGSLLYVGKASMSDCIGGRLSNYFGADKATGQCRVRHEWSTGPRYVATLAVAQNMPFEAAALEEFLIQRLPTTDNTRGTHNWKFNREEIHERR